ncbi:MAG: AMP-binding protein [Syntrophobacterales bacterium]|nr:AMP-binding protein [Syntrophobacterales bacterium]
MFADSCSTYKDNTALVYENSRISFSRMDAAVNSLANRLKSIGIGRGDKAALMLPNTPEFPITYFACQKLGAVAVTLNVMSTAYELQYLLDNSDAKALVTSAQSARRFEEIKDRLATCRHLLLTEMDEGPLSLKKALEAGPFEFEPSDAAEDDPAVMIYTSGLTGKPLGAVLTHGNLISQSRLLADLFDGSEKDTGLSLIPLFHSFGAVANMLNPILMGACAVMLDAFSIDSIFKAIETEKITYMTAVPRVYLGMLLQEGTEKYDMSSLKYCVTGGSAMPPAYMPQFEKKFRVPIREGYGLTEASPVCSVTRLHMQQKPGSIGVPIPGVEARIVDDTERELPRGEIGELIVRGPNVMPGYYKDPEATAAVIRNGWLHTGDLALIDADGHIFLKGRKKRMIITSGFNVYPREVEIVLNMHPIVAESKVIGKSDLMRGEVVKALVVKKEGASADEKAILKHCRTYLSSYKIPREIEFVDRLS